MSAPQVARRRGMPLAVLALTLGAWVAGRAALWESPFALPDLGVSEMIFAETQGADEGTPYRNGNPMQAGLAGGEMAHDALTRVAWDGSFAAPLPATYWQGYSDFADNASIAAGHQHLMTAAFRTDWHSTGFASALGGDFLAGQPAGQRAASRSARVQPFAAPPVPSRASPSDRWALDVIAYYRAGSSTLSTAQGRVPVYGASQLAANLQYRAAPRSRHDPRAFIRAYRALLADAETELAAGFSARPLGSLPLRIVGEARGTRNAAGTDIRPAGYAVTEFPAQSLPLGFSLESYAAAGYVGGEADTYFVDGQASLTRELASIDGPGDSPMRLSVGGAAWGGAQEDAQRLDVGPTMRLDLSVGEVPARVSLDWRQRVAGDAAPDSGVAATVSTRF